MRIYSVVAWVDCAFGPFWAFQKGWLSWLSGIADNALYPIIFLDCLLKFADLGDDSNSPSVLHLLNSSDEGGNDAVRWLFMLAVTIVLTYLNYRGLDVVGAMAIGICLFSMLPFVVFCIVGSFKVQPARYCSDPLLYLLVMQCLSPEGGWRDRPGASELWIGDCFSILFSGTLISGIRRLLSR